MLGVTHGRGDEGRVHIWLLGRQRCVRCVHTYQNIRAQAGGALGGGGCGPARHYSVSTEDTNEDAQSARISSIVANKGGLCCCLAEKEVHNLSQIMKQSSPILSVDADLDPG